jgi:hydrophobic/amphiphilic exporter-1 (mainly G- bacteria), HAE1 family
MNLSEIFIRRPVMTVLVMLAILLFGAMSYTLLPISALPSVEYPFIQVSASLPGATPEVMAASVAAPLERQFTEIAGLNSFNSSSSTGSTSISLQFDFSRRVDEAAKDVQAAISAAAGQLPTGMPKPPTYRKVNPSVAPILYLYLYSDTTPISTVDDYAEVTISQPISSIDGVAQVSIFGQKQYAVRVQLDPKALASKGIGINDVRSAIAAGNVNLPTGSLSGDHKSYLIQANGQLSNADAYRSLNVIYKNGAAVKLQDLGTVLDDVQNNKITNRYSDDKVTNKKAIVLAVQPQPGANTVQIVDTIKAMMPNLRAQVPQSVQMGIFYDRSLSIRSSVDDVKFTLVLSICLVVLVIFLFLRNVTATIIPSLAIPVAIIGTFAAMYVLGYSLNNLSLMALTLAVGFVVDDAIVVLENITRHQEMGEDRKTAAFKGSREIGFTIVSMTLSLVAVFIPIMFMGGLIGKLFHEFAITISIAILVSGFVSLSLTPMLCSRFLSAAPSKPNFLYRALERGFDLLLRGYAWTLRPVLKYRSLTIVVSLMILLGTGYLFTLVSKGLIPNEDTGQITANTKAAQDISFENMLEHQQQIVNIIRKDPNIAAINSTVGSGGPNGSANSGRLTIRLKPRDQRKLSSEEIIKELGPKLRRTPGIQAFLRSPAAIPLGGQQTNSQYQLTVQSLDLAELRKYMPILLERVQAIPGLRGVDSDLQLATPQINVAVDHDKAALLGVSVAQIQRTLGDAYGSGQVSTIYGANNQYTVVLELKPEYQRDPSALSSLYVRSAAPASTTAQAANAGQTSNIAQVSTNPQASTTGQAANTTPTANTAQTSTTAQTANAGVVLPLSSVATITQGIGPLTVNHLSGMPSATISFDTLPGVSLSDATALINKAAAEVLPSTVTASFQGAAQAFNDSFTSLGGLLVVSIVVIYLILGILYEDFIHPITILSGLPSAGFGALLTLLVFGVELNLYSFIGIILLIGIVKKNGIMLVDFAIERQRHVANILPQQAIYEACLVRFRPIMMTTMAALIGTIPIALGAGSGSEARRPLGIAIVGGLFFSQILTLYLTPVFYIYLESLRQYLGRKKLKRAMN